VLLLDVEQGTREWFDARRGVPTASEASRIITPGGKASASQDAYIGELIDQIVRPDEQEAFAGNIHTERGKELEPQARDWFRFVMRFSDIRSVGFALRDDRAAGCSPDSLNFVNSTPCAGLEIKAPEGKKHVMWMLANELPDEHKQQVHMSLAVTDLQEWHFLSYCPGYKPFHVRVVRDRYTEIVRAELDKFILRLAEAKAAFIDYLPMKEAA